MRHLHVRVTSVRKRNRERLPICMHVQPLICRRQHQGAVLSAADIRVLAAVCRVIGGIKGLFKAQLRCMPCS